MMAAVAREQAASGRDILRYSPGKHFRTVKPTVRMKLISAAMEEAFREDGSQFGNRLLKVCPPCLCAHRYACVVM